LINSDRRDKREKSALERSTGLIAEESEWQVKSEQEKGNNFCLDSLSVWLVYVTGLLLLNERVQ